MYYRLHSTADVLLIIVIVFFTVAIIFAIASRIHNFRRDLDWLNREIQRTQGEERQYWKEEKRRLWLSLLPFFPKK